MNVLDLLLLIFILFIAFDTLVKSINEYQACLYITFSNLIGKSKPNLWYEICNYRR